MTNNRYLSDPPRADVFVCRDGNQLHCSRRTVESTNPVDCQVNLPLDTPDEWILRAIWIWEAGFERGKEHGEHGLAKRLRGLLRIQP